MLHQKTDKQGQGRATVPDFSVQQKKSYQSEFSYGGYVIFEDGSEYPAFLAFKNSELIEVSLPKKVNDEGFYLHSKSVKYDLTKKRDRNRLKRKGVVGCRYETPTTLSLTYDVEQGQGTATRP